MNGIPTETLTTLVNIKDTLSKVFEQGYLNDRDDQDLYMAFATLNDIIKRHKRTDEESDSETGDNQTTTI